MEKPITQVIKLKNKKIIGLLYSIKINVNYVILMANVILFVYSCRKKIQNGQFYREINKICNEKT